MLKIQGTKIFSREVECFLAIYRAGSLAGAAGSLAMDQGNLSRYLKKLEGKTGPLFHRHHWGLRPNDQAVQLSLRLQSVEQVWRSGRNSAGVQAPMEVLRIGCHSSIGRNYLPRIYSQLEVHPAKFELDLTLMKSTEVTRLVQERKLDLGVVANPVKSKDVLLKRIATERIELASRDASVIGRTLLYNPEMIFEGGLRKGLEFKRIMEIRDYEIIAETCSLNSSFVGMIPSSVRARYPELKSLQILKDQIVISLITFPGSKALPLLKLLS